MPQHQVHSGAFDADGKHILEMVDESDLHIHEEHVREGVHHVVHTYFRHKGKNAIVRKDVVIHTHVYKPGEEKPTEDFRRRHHPHRVTPTGERDDEHKAAAGIFAHGLAPRGTPGSGGPTAAMREATPEPGTLGAGQAGSIVLPQFSGGPIELLLESAWAGACEAVALARRARRFLGHGLAILAITAAICNSFKTQLATATHDFTSSTGDTFKLALYTSSATLGASTTAYSSTNEVSGTGYSAGGSALTSTTPALDSSTACWLFSTLTWGSATITARGCLIYNSSKSNKAVAVYNFGSDQTSTSGNFTITFGAQTAGNAVIQLA